MTPKEQQRNRRNNRYLEHGGERLPMVVWAERLKINVHTIRNRIDRCGWSVERAVTTPRFVMVKKVRPPKPPRKKSVRAMAAERGISYGTVTVRVYQLGWTLEKALDTPVGATPKKPDPTSMSGRCRAAGVSLSNAYSRMRRYGLTFEQALDFKPREYRK